MKSWSLFRELGGLNVAHMDDARRPGLATEWSADGMHKWSPYPLLRDRRPSVYTQQTDGRCSGAEAEEMEGSEGTLTNRLAKGQRGLKVVEYLESRIDYQEV